jgi:DNA invertase Pin-like site-specific DNA recombinase
MQLRELREYTERRGWTVAGEYVDTGWSGAKTSRPELDRLMCDASLRRCDAVIVWKLDRCPRIRRRQSNRGAPSIPGVPATAWLRRVLLDVATLINTF